ncbi:uncharacterized protein LOC121982292 [Zingiber officinale]|uniref:Uncharacterized protein n=1 Tax=Zingiber officinale TaxID=94328 RepID=A0A8J5GS71_ZINOF|nr:uncharacterized protein LOC121982292 [Zingiber officinale]KAG6508990.1 hypothetical protein ZIOFF_034373 [Zingiber officinale]
MDPQIFFRLSIGSLGLRLPVDALKDRPSAVPAYSKCSCDIRLGDLPIRRTRVPLVSSPRGSPDAISNPVVFYLAESDVKTLTVSRHFSVPKPNLQITVYMGKQGSHCGVTGRRLVIGCLGLEIGLEQFEKPTLLHNGWIGLRQKKGGEVSKHGPELHLQVRLDPDPRYVFKFEDETTLSPQIVQQQGAIKQPIFSCKFVKDRRSSMSDEDGDDAEKRERKGWKVKIHDLSGSVVAAAFMATPFVPSTGCDRVDRSNPGAWLILHPNAAGSAESWQPWGRLEAWREIGHPRDTICLRLQILSEGQEASILVSDVAINTDKGGEFNIDMDRHEPIAGGFVMNCKVSGEEKCSEPLVQLAARHVTCVEDAAIFMALAAAVDLSVKACRPFGRKAKKGVFGHSFCS